ncbi:MAG: hypothetical protein LBU79_06545 [Planctomycetota bacterium]|jgi:hypothetical protein|nr:hypothetical protein [Planctomycetota bacterium]
MMGREAKIANDLFYVCSVIEQIGRDTKNRRADVVGLLGEKEITRILDLADVLHCEPIATTAAELTQKQRIVDGDFDNVANCKYTVPKVFDIAKVYKRLIVSVAGEREISPVAALIEIYSSWVSGKIDDYNSSMYFENPQYLYESYLAGEPLRE